MISNCSKFCFHIFGACFRIIFVDYLFVSVCMPIVKNFHTTVHCSMYFNALYLSDVSLPSGNTADNSNLQIIVIFVLKNKGPTKM